MESRKFSLRGLSPLETDPDASEAMAAGAPETLLLGAHTL